MIYYKNIKLVKKEEVETGSKQTLDFDLFQSFSCRLQSKDIFTLHMAQVCYELSTASLSQQHVPVDFSTPFLKSTPERERERERESCDQTRK